MGQFALGLALRRLSDDKAFTESPDEVYGRLLDMGASIIQTDRPELLIRYLEAQGRRK